MEFNNISTDHASFFESLPTIEGKDPIDVLPVEMSLKIFSELQPADLKRCALVCKKWQPIAQDKNLWIHANAFGAKKWKEYFGIEVDSPLLPSNIYQILKRQCPFSEKGKKVEDTHLLVLVPGSINGEPLTLRTFGKFLGNIFPEFGESGYPFLWPEAEECGGNGESHWVLMTKDLLSGSRDKHFDKQQKQIEDQGKRKYQVPEALDVVVCAISAYACSSTRLFHKIPPIFTICKEKFRIYHVIIGQFNQSGLNVSFNHFPAQNIGVAALRKL